MTIADDKAALRAEVRARRRERSPDERSAAATALAHHGHSLVRSRVASGTALVTAYLSLPAEPGTDALISALTADGHAVWVPRIVGADLSWVAYRAGDALQRGPLGIREPTGAPVPDEDLAGLDLLLLPGLACDRRGRRLGQGGGYYDRVLARLDPHADGGPLRVVLLHDDELVDAVPTEEHDALVDGVLMPSGYVPLG